MMNTATWTFSSLFFSLFIEFLVVVAGVLFALIVNSIINKIRFGRWRVVVLKNGATLVNREVSHHKAKQVLQESSELSVFLKGVVSPYGWINCDLVSAGIERGLLVVDRGARQFIIDLNKNPSQTESNGRTTKEVPPSQAALVDDTNPGTTRALPA